MNKIVFIIQRKAINGKERSLDLALSYLKSNFKLNYHRWLNLNGSSTRIGRTSYKEVVLPGIVDINSAISKYLPDFHAFEIIKEPWRSNMYHRSIAKHKDVTIEEDDKHFYVEVERTGAA